MSALSAQVTIDDHLTSKHDRIERLDQNILYAQKLQDALFRNKTVEDHFKDGFIIDQPKDAVGGDFYLVDSIAGQKMILVGDCTGHGPSGAMLSALCVSILKELLNKYKTLSPALIITKALDRLASMLDNGDDYLSDGMEATLLFINESKKQIKFASTGQYVFTYGSDVSKTIKTRHVGYEKSSVNIEDQCITYTDDTMIYVSTDGMKDQFGSETGRRFSNKRLESCFSDFWELSGRDQSDKIKERFQDWQGTLEEQTDDILLLGIRL